MSEKNGISDVRIYSKGRPIGVANKNVDWTENANIRDFHLAFIDLSHLEEESNNFHHPSSIPGDSFSFPSKSKIEEFVRTGGRMFVILPYKKTASFDYSPILRTSKEKSYDLFSWLPFDLETEENERGSSVKSSEEWDWYFGNEFNWNRTLKRAGTWDNTGHRSLSANIKTIAENRYEKQIAGKVTAKGHLTEDWGGIFLIPPSKEMDYDYFVESVLSNICGFGTRSEQTTEPEWVEEYTTPYEGELSKEISELESKLEEIQKHKALLYGRGSDLERAVREAFQDLGFEIGDEIPGRRDGTVELENRRIVFEIYGTENGMRLNKCRQLDDWVRRALEEDPNKDITGLKIVNPYRKEKPPERDAGLTGNVKNFMEQRGYKVLLTADLYSIMDRYKDDKITFVEVEEWLNGDGIFLDIDDIL